MLEDLLRVSKGKHAERENSDLSEILHNVMAAYSDRSASQNVSLVLKAEAPQEVLMEYARIERVFHNLLENALEMMPSGGSIVVTSRPSAGNVEVTIEDTGPGISPEIRDQLFQPFVSHGKKNGLGLGLALSRQTVLEHGGDMWAAKSATGGACFHIRLPLVPASAMQAAPIT